MLVLLGQESLLMSVISEKIFDNQNVIREIESLTDFADNDVVAGDFNTFTDLDIYLLNLALLRNVTIILENFTTKHLSLHLNLEFDAGLVGIKIFDNGNFQDYVPYNIKENGDDLFEKISFIVRVIDAELYEHEVIRSYFDHTSKQYLVEQKEQEQEQQQEVKHESIKCIAHFDPFKWSVKDSTQFNLFQPTIECEWGVVKDLNLKVLKLTSKSSYFSVPSLLEKDDLHNRRWYNSRAEFIIFPGTPKKDIIQRVIDGDFNYFDVPHDVNNCNIREVQPSNPNKESELKTTTGYSFGLGSEGGKPSISFSHSQSEEYTQKIQDFECRFSRQLTACHWVYEYNYKNNILVDPGKLKWMTVRDLPSLAKGTLDVKNEVIYTFPIDVNVRQEFNVIMKHEVGGTKVSGFKDYYTNYSVAAEMWSFTVNLGSVG